MFSNWGVEGRRERPATKEERQAIEAALKAHQAAPSLETLAPVARMVRELYADGVPISALTSLFNCTWGAIEQCIGGIPSPYAFMTPKPERQTRVVRREASS